MLPDALFLNVHMYGIMIAIGVLAAVGVLYFYGKKKSISMKLLDFIFYDGILSTMLGFGCAALFQSFYNYLEHPENGFHLGEGITFIGGLIGGSAIFFIAYFAFRKKLNIRIIDAFPLLPCLITVAHGFGRIGCFFAGCCYGKQTDSWLGVTFKAHESLGPVYPTQLFEAVFLFILFGALTFLYFRYKYKYNFTVYLIGYGVFRFLNEFLRGDDRGAFFLGLSPSQWLSIAFVIGGVVIIPLTKKWMASREKELKNNA